MAFYCSKFKKVWEYPDNDKKKKKRQELKYIAMYELTIEQFLAAHDLKNNDFHQCEYIYKLYEESILLKTIYSNNPALIAGKTIG